MCNPVGSFILVAAGAVSILALSCPAPAAEPVYRCVKNGKASYATNPSANDGQCQETVIRDDGPKPEELTRLLEEKKRRQEEEARANEAALREREIRAKEIEAAAAARSARAIEEQLQSQQPQSEVPVYGYPTYWGGGLGQPYPQPPIVRPSPPAPQPPPQSPPVRGFTSH